MTKICWKMNFVSPRIPVVGTNPDLDIACGTGIFPALALDVRATTGDLVEPEFFD
jgi:hypothetical protein